MKKYLLYIFLFFGIVAVVDCGFGLGCEWLQIHAKGGRMKGVRQSALEQTADIVVMGSSRAHHHYVSSVLNETVGMTAHNAGVDGNGIVLVTGIYEMIEDRYLPKVVIYDVEPTFDLNVYAEDGKNTRYIGWLRPYYKHPKVKDILCRVDSKERFKNLSALFRYNSKIVDLLKDQIVLGDFTADGYAPLRGEMTKIPVFKNNEEDVIQDTLKVSMLEEFILRMSQSQTQLIMIASPKYGAVSSEIFAPVKEMCAHYGVAFWDYYYEPEFQNMKYFKEPMHLNDLGARTFCRTIGERLSVLLAENE